MKKPLNFVLILAIGYIVSYLFAGNPTKVCAQGNGEACCSKPGYSLVAGLCLNDDVISICGSIANVSCRIKDALDKMPYAECYPKLNNNCLVNSVSRGFGVDKAESYCNAFGLILGITPVGLPFYAACRVVISPFLIFYGNIQTDLCDSGLYCNTTTGMCQGSPPPGGPTIPVYDPGCTPGDTENVKTALGCLPTDPFPFVNLLLPWATLVGAGIAFLLGIFGAFMISISAGNPEKMQAGRELITSAIGGLLLIIFAVFILKVVGVNILGLFIGGK